MFCNILKYHLFARNLNTFKFDAHIDNQLDWLNNTIEAAAPAVLPIKGSNLITTGNVSISIKTVAGEAATLLLKKPVPTPLKKSRLANPIKILLKANALNPNNSILVIGC